MAATQPAGKPGHVTDPFQPAARGRRLGGGPSAPRMVSDLAVNRARSVSELPEDQRLCRIHGHDWPKLVFNRPVPWNIDYVPDPSGSFQRVEICARCEKRRWRWTKRGGAMDREEHWRYNPPPGGWMTLPAELEVTRLDLVEANDEVCLPMVLAAMAGRGRELADA